MFNKKVRFFIAILVLAFFLINLTPYVITASAEELQSSLSVQEEDEQIRLMAVKPTVMAATMPEGTTTVRDSWYPSASSDAKNNWQIVNGTYLDGQNGASTQESNTAGDVIVRKNVMPTDDENVFRIALKVKTKASWANVLDATTCWLQNGNSASSSQKHYFLISKPSSGGPYVKVTVNFVDSVSPSVNGRIVYKKDFWVSMEKGDSQGNWFLYWGNPLLDNNNHSMGQKGVPADGSQYYVPIGQYMSSMDQLHHAAVAGTVTDIMGEGIEYVEDSIEYKTDIPGVNGLSDVTVSGNTLTWTIDSDGTIPVGQDYQLIKDTAGGKISYYREYDLVYKIHLDTTKLSFEPGREYDTNKKATLTYSYDPRPESDISDFQDYDRDMKSIDFPVPSVKGTLYGLSFTKTDEDTGEPLAGATFSLTGNYGVSTLGYNTAAENDSVNITVTTDENGVAFINDLPWGVYTLKEESAPLGYDLTFSPETYTLCYTTDADLLEENGVRYKLKSSLIGNNGIITNKSWPSSELTLKKVVINADEIILEQDQNAEFPIVVSGYDSNKVLFFDKDGKYIDPKEMVFLLKDGESLCLTVKMKENNTVDITEDLQALKHFKYNRIKIAQGSYSSKTIALDPEVNLSATVENEYIPQKTDLEILKTDSEKNGLSDAEFALYTSIQRDAPENAESLKVGDQIYYKITSVVTDSDGKATLENLSTLENPEYLLVETTAPDGYLSPDEKIFFTVNEDKVFMLNSQGSDYILERYDDGIFYIHVYNYPGYELPQTGGPGTKWFTWGGILLMLIALMYGYSLFCGRERGNRKS